MSLSEQAVSALRNSVAGQVILPDHAKYDEIRQIWNAMIDRKPAVIVQCGSAADVPHALRFAHEQGLEVSIRGAGHNIAGNSICNDGLMIDFSTMKKVTVDPSAARARVEPGATLADFDAECQKHGLATPVGINSTTGIAGLTLGGGFGWLTRKYGLTVDNLISVKAVLADGSTVRASETANKDLFWALRGGGGNFAVVTEFEFQLHRVGPEVFAGLIVFPFAEARQVLQRYRDFVRNASEDLNVWVVMRKAPPLPFLPAEVHGKEVVILAVFYSGNPAEGATAAAPLKGFGHPVGEHMGPMPYVNWQQAFDPLLTPGMRNYWKSHNFTDLSDGAIDTALEYAGKLPSPHCEIFFGLIAGAANRAAPDAMAYGHRDAKLVANVHGRWEQASEDKAVIGWARGFFDAATPYASDGIYVNFMTEDEGSRVASAYGPNYARLAELKQKFDPENVFHINQNIKPSGA